MFLYACMLDCAAEVEILHQEQGVLFAQVLPPIMLGSLTAILRAGSLNWVGKRRPHLTGEGRLQPGVGEELVAGEEKAAASAVDASAIAAAGVTAIALYLLGTACFKLFGLPGPVAMLFFAVAVKLTQAVPPSLQLAGQVVYRFFSTAVTYPLLFAIGVSLTPWDTLVAALTPANIVVIVSTVASVIATGFFVGRLLGMYPIESAIVNACHSGQGGTGDIAILTAANRLQLMPFAQIATRIGGAITVTLTLIVLAQLAYPSWCPAEGPAPE
jgi:Na+/citrate or Na+/malate symporter